MAVQLPEPDYYTLKEILERWGTTETILFRLAREGKVRMGFDPPYFFPLSVFGSWVDDEGVEHDEEIPPEVLHRQTLYTLDDTDKNIIWTNNPILLHPTGVPNNEVAEWEFRRDFFPSTMLLWPKKTIPWIAELPEDWFLMVPISIQAEMLTEFNDHRDLRTGIAVANRCRIPIGRIIIPATEVRRVENRHQEAENAAADDVLGTKDKEKLQAIIAAMVQIVASKAPGYKRGDKPNAAQIAEAIEKTGLVDRRAGTIAKEISKAWDNFGR